MELLQQDAFCARGFAVGIGEPPGRELLHDRSAEHTGDDQPDDGRDHHRAATADGERTHASEHGSPLTSYQRLLNIDNL
ncbi:MAG: hypothetical protein E6G46_06600 [Actinobacteria bacterium]|nr:MAG: hypothetical protein E6G46_06600 [Actinomycetota bacterium]